jgi:hypothetical protein
MHLVQGLQIACLDVASRVLAGIANLAALLSNSGRCQAGTRDLRVERPICSSGC